MKLGEMLEIIDSNIRLEMPMKIEEYQKKEDISKERMNYEVEHIEFKNNLTIIRLCIPNKIPTLEALGYSFETGV